MTLKTFFNKGIYLNTLKRFWVGSFMYFLLMFLFSTLWDSGAYYDDFSYHIGLNCILSMFVAPVVAILLYKFIHSKKNSIFIHSMPVTRSANYISSLLGGLTLVSVPVLLMGVLYLLVTNDVEPSLFWTFCVLLCNFGFFSVATLAANLTGASWVSVPIYIGLNGAGTLIAGYEDLLMDTFATGYSYGGGIIGEIAQKSNMYYLLMSIPEYNGDFITLGSLRHVFILISVALVLYVLSFVLYKKRHMERCEDASAYKIFNYVLKYVVTIAVSYLSFGLFATPLEGNVPTFAVGTIILTAVAYFGTEMILKKSLKVLSSYKGYIFFLICYFGVILFFAFTSIFGYETYVPKLENIASISVTIGYSDNNNFSDAECMALATEIHKEIIKSECENVYNEWATIGNRFSYTYQMKDGSNIKRTYVLENDKGREYMDRLYQLKTFKRSTEKIFNIEPESAYDIDIFNYPYDSILNHSDYSALIECIKADVLEQSYTNLHPKVLYDDRGDSSEDRCSIIICFEAKSEKLVEVDNIRYYLTPYYTNTLNFLESKGFTEIKSVVK